MAIAELESDPSDALGRAAAAVVVFYTIWCGDCARSLGYERKLSGELEGKVEFFRMDAEKHEQIADKYLVERYPTYLFFREGKQSGSILVEPSSEREARDWVTEKLAGIEDKKD